MPLLLLAMLPQLPGTTPLTLPQPLLLLVMLQQALESQQTPSRVTGQPSLTLAMLPLPLPQLLVFLAGNREPHRRQMPS